MKKILNLILIVFILLSSIINVHADTPEIDKSIQDIKVYVNDTRIDMNEVFIVDGKLFVPLRSLTESMGLGTVDWNQELRAATVMIDNFSFEFCLNEDILKIEGKEINSDSLLFVENNGRIYVQARAFAAFFGADRIVWNGEANATYIYKEGIAVPEHLIYKEEVVPVVEVKKIQTYSDEDLYWLSRIIEAEASNEPYSGKLAVANVVINRTKSPLFPNTIKAVIFDNSNGVQFTPSVNGTINNKPCEESIKAAKEALEGNNNIGNCLYFVQTKSTKCWVNKNRKFSQKIGGHNFYY